MIAPVCVADKDIEFDSFVAADVAADIAAVVVVIAAVVATVDADVVDAVADTAVVIVTAVAAVAAAVGPVVFVAPNQLPRKKIRRGQRSRYQTPSKEKIFRAVMYIYIIRVFLFNKSFDELRKRR